MITPASPDPVVTAQRLTAALEGVEGRLREAVAVSEKASQERDKALAEYGKRNRWFIVFDVALTVLLAVSGAISVHAADQASHANSAQLALCRAGNVARAQQVQLWEYVINLNPPKTRQARAIVAKFEHHLVTIFAPRNCAALGSKKS